MIHSALEQVFDRSPSTDLSQVFRNSHTANIFTYPLPISTYHTTHVHLSTNHLFSMAAVSGFRPELPRLAIPKPPSRRAELVQLRRGVDIAVEYFNADDRDKISELTAKAKKWCENYFDKGYVSPNTRATALLQTYPNLFNLNTPAHLRAVPATMTSAPNHSEPEGASPQELIDAERQTMNSEPFPQFTEPTLASPEDMDEIIDLRPRLPRSNNAAAKPNMRVDAKMLRGSGILAHVPEFLEQLSRSNMELETKLASNPADVRLEMDDETAAQQPHIQVNLLAGIMESQKNRHARRIILPGGRPFKQEQEDGDETDGADSDGSSSTSSSRSQLRLVSKKRKAQEMSKEPSPSPSVSSASSDSSGGPTRTIKLKVPIRIGSANSSNESSRSSTPDSQQSSSSSTRSSERLRLKASKSGSVSPTNPSSRRTTPESRMNSGYKVRKPSPTPSHASTSSSGSFKYKIKANGKILSEVTRSPTGELSGVSLSPSRSVSPTASKGPAQIKLVKRPRPDDDQDNIVARGSSPPKKRRVSEVE